VRRDEHGATRELAVVEREEEAAAFVPSFVVIAAERKGAAAQLREADEDSEEVTEMAERLENAIRERGDVGRETYTQEIERVDFAGSMSEADEIDGTSAAFEKSLH
jgi:hypothetical protein